MNQSNTRVERMYVEQQKQLKKQKRRNCCGIFMVFVLILIAIVATLVCLYYFTDIFKKGQPTPEDPDGPVIDDEIAKNFPEFKATPKGLYAWSHAKERVDGLPAWNQLLKNKNYAFDRLVEFALFNGITEITLFDGSIEWEYDTYFKNGKLPLEKELKECIQKLNKKSIDVNLAFYVNDDPNVLTNSKYGKEVATIVSKLGSEYKVKSIQWDQEPSDVSVYEDLVIMLRESNNIFPTGSSLKPKWFNDIIESMTFTDPALIAWCNDNKSTIVTFADLVISYTTGSEVMAYQSTWDKVKTLADKMKASAKKFDKPCNILVETGNDGAATDETLYQQIADDYVQFYKDFTDFAPKYDHVTIHDYRQYFMAFYGSEPVDWRRLSTKVNHKTPHIPNSQKPGVSYE